MKCTAPVTFRARHSIATHLYVVVHRLEAWAWTGESPGNIRRGARTSRLGINQTLRYGSA